jgi:hypothetical protein
MAMDELTPTIELLESTVEEMYDATGGADLLELIARALTILEELTTTGNQLLEEESGRLATESTSADTEGVEVYNGSSIEHSE